MRDDDLTRRDETRERERDETLYGFRVLFFFFLETKKIVTQSFQITRDSPIDPKNAHITKVKQKKCRERERERESFFVLLCCVR